MSKITFNKETIEVLKKNKYVLKVSEKSITYSDEFKRLFIEEYLIGKTPRVIFEESGFDVNVLGTKRYEQAAARWVRCYNNDGIVGLRDTRKENTGRPTDKEVTKDDIMKAYNYRGYNKGSRSIKMILQGEFPIIYSRKKFNVL